MKNLKSLLQKVSISKPSGWIIILFILISLIGFTDSSYLFYKHGSAVPCSESGCNEVLASSYSEVFGIPLAFFGVIYYLFIFLGAVLYYDLKNIDIFKILIFATPVGFLASMYFVYLQLFVIHAICTYCMASAVSSTLLFLMSIAIVVKCRKLTKV